MKKSLSELSSGYIAKSNNRSDIFSVVLFFGNIRIKGYVSRNDLLKLSDGNYNKVTIHKRWLKTWLE